MDQIALYILLLMVVFTMGGYLLNQNIALDKFLDDHNPMPPLNLGDEKRSLKKAYGWDSQASYHGYFTAWMVAFAMFIVFIGGSIFRTGETLFDVSWLALTLLVGSSVIYLTSLTIGADFRARTWVERFVQFILVVLSIIAVLTTFGIIISLLVESLIFFSKVPFLEFLFGLHWSPQTAIRAEQAGQSGAFGAIPVFSGTFLIMLVAMVIAGPVGLMIAIYLSEYATKKTRQIVKPLIEILAGIPTVVYGFFALITVGPSIRNFADLVGFSIPTQSAIAAGVVMGIMVIPLISSLSDDVINAVPQGLRDGSYALGATKSETMKHVVFRSALPGVCGAFLLAISRAIGETMIVVMAAGKAANLTGNPFEAVTTVTVQIVSLLTGDQEFDSPKTLAAFALGLVLFVITLILNMIALSVVRQYRETHE